MPTWTHHKKPLTARNTLRGLMALPWTAAVHGPLRLKRPGND